MNEKYAFCRKKPICLTNGPRILGVQINYSKSPKSTRIRQIYRCLEKWRVCSSSLNQQSTNQSTKSIFWWHHLIMVGLKKYRTDNWRILFFLIQWKNVIKQLFSCCKSSPELWSLFSLNYQSKADCKSRSFPHQHIWPCPPHEYQGRQPLSLNKSHV